MVTHTPPSHVNDDTVIMSLKTPMMPRPTTARLPGRLNLRASVQQFTKETPKDAHASRMIQQLLREMSNVHHFLVVRPGSGIEQVDPDSTTLEAIAVPREIRKEGGFDYVRVASVEIQQYAKVGSVSDGVMYRLECVRDQVSI
jgi:hypothetical protein